MTDPKRWEENWQRGWIPFHRNEVNPVLKKYFPSPAPERVLVPLCGKSLDMGWLAKKSSEVVGVELVALAVEFFFQEHQIPYEKEKKEGFHLYKGRNIQIYQGDFFDLAPEETGTFPFIYDRAALVALDKDTRPSYAKHLQSFLQEDGIILLVGLEYEPSEGLGPPFSVPKGEIQSHYPGFQIEVLEKEASPVPPHLAEKGIQSLMNTVYYIKK
ncbi:MAG: thiopurine S-methyltransferase [Planctomycetota bacterium]|nr:MAG: thiopurine S-methyltransferase [Planctomycetota bacterium]